MIAWIVWLALVAFLCLGVAAAAAAALIRAVADVQRAGEGP